jgi:hypothetical protein
MRELLNQASESIRLATASKIVPPKDFFVQAAQALNSLAATTNEQAITEAGITLVDYNSSLEHAPSFGKVPSAVVRPLTTAEIKKLFGILTVFSWTGPPEVDMLSLPTAPSGQKLATNVGGVFADAWQTLDGFRFEGTTFINMHLAYKGGPAQLHKVNFINCTFSISHSPQAIPFTEYVTLDKSDFEAS